MGRLKIRLLKCLKWFNALSTAGLKALLLAAAMTMSISIIFSAVTRDSRQVITIEEFSVSDDAESYANGAFLSRAVFNEINSVIKHAISQKQSSLADHRSYPEPNVAFEFHGMTIDGVQSVFQDFVSDHTGRISGQLSKDGELLKLVLTMPNEPATSTVFKTQDIEVGIKQVAYKILEKTEPYLLARRLSLTDEPDFSAISRLIASLLSNGSPQDDFWALNLAGNMLVRKEQYGLALPKYRKATETALSFDKRLSRISRSNEAGVLINLDKYEEAEKILRGPDIFNYYNAHFVKGLLHYRKQEYSAAEKSLGRAWRMSPNDPDTANLHGRVLLALGKEQQAVEAYMGAYYLYRDRERHQSAQNAIVAAAQIYENKSDHASAAEVYLTGIEGAPNEESAKTLRYYYEALSIFEDGFD